METKTITEKICLLEENSTNYFIEQEMIDTVINSLSSLTSINRETDVKPSIVFLKIKTTLSNNHDFNAKLQEIFNSFNGEIEWLPDGVVWVKLVRPTYRFSYGVYGLAYLCLFLFQMFYYFSGTSGMVYQLLFAMITS